MIDGSIGASHTSPVVAGMQRLMKREAADPFWNSSRQNLKKSGQVEMRVLLQSWGWTKNRNLQIQSKKQWNI